MPRAKSEKQATRCPACSRFVPLLADGRTFSKHTALKNPKSGECSMSNRKAPTPEAASRLRTALETAFFEYFGLAYKEWGPDADEVSAAQAAMNALRTVNFLVVDGQVYLVTESHEVDESGGERHWTVTTDDEGGLHDLGGPLVGDDAR